MGWKSDSDLCSDFTLVLLCSYLVELDASCLGGTYGASLSSIRPRVCRRARRTGFSFPPPLPPPPVATRAELVSRFTGLPAPILR